VEEKQALKPERFAELEQLAKEMAEKLGWNIKGYSVNE
jgi:hypothetical protein